MKIVTSALVSHKRAELSCLTWHSRKKRVSDIHKPCLGMRKLPNVLENQSCFRKRNQWSRQEDTSSCPGRNFRRREIEGRKGGCVYGLTH